MTSTSDNDDDDSSVIGWREGLTHLQSLLHPTNTTTTDDNDNDNEVEAEVDYEAVSKLSLSLLSTSTSSSDTTTTNPDGDMPSDVQRTIRHVFLKSLLERNMYKDVIDQVETWRKKEEGGNDGVGGGGGEDADAADGEWTYVEEEAYACYRQSLYDKCRSVCERYLQCTNPELLKFVKKNKKNGGSNNGGEDDVPADGVTSSRLRGLLHVYGQSLYRLGNNDVQSADKSLNVYSILLSNDKDDEEGTADEEEMESLLTNYVAASGITSLAANNNDGGGGEGGLLDSLYGTSQTLRQIMDGKMEEGGDEEDAWNYDLTYNVATVMAVQSQTMEDVRQSMLLLQRAEKVCTSALSDSTDAERKMELAPIQCNLAYTHLLEVGAASSSSSGPGTSNGSKTKDDGTKLPEVMFAKVLMSKNVAAVGAASNNIAVIRANRGIHGDGSTRGGRGGRSQQQQQQSQQQQERDALNDAMKKLPDVGTSDNKKLMTTSQRNAVTRNRAVVLFRMGRAKECREVLAILRSTTTGASSSSSPKKKKGGGFSGGGGMSADDAMNGLLADLLESCLLEKEGMTKEADQVLEKCKKSLSSKGNDMGLARVQLHKAQLALDGGDIDGAISILQGLPASIQTCPGVTATLVELSKQRDGSEEDIPGVKELRDGGSDLAEDSSLRCLRRNKARADYMVHLGMHDEAMGIYEGLVDCTTALADEDRWPFVASLVQALSVVDPGRAEELVADLPLGGGDSDDDELDGDELEQRALPRSQRVRKLIAVDRRKESRTKDKSGNQAARLRQRAKKKATYLTKLETEGNYNPQRPSKPDPERWIPKKQRSYNKRGRKGRNRFVGAQGAGAGTEKDAAKLDAAARAAGKADGGPSKPSTAHMAASSGGGSVRRGGRKKR